MFALVSFFHHPWDFTKGQDYTGHPMTVLRPDLFTTEPPTKKKEAR